MTNHGPALPLLSAYAIYCGMALAAVAGLALALYCLFPVRRHK